MYVFIADKQQQEEGQIIRYIFLSQIQEFIDNKAKNY